MKIVHEAINYTFKMPLQSSKDLFSAADFYFQEVQTKEMEKRKNLLQCV